MTTPLSQRKALPERIRISCFDDPSGSTPLPLPSRRTWPFTLVMGICFVIMGSIAGIQIASMHGQEVKSVFDLMTFLFQSFWVLGWSVGVFIFGALTFLCLFYGESARLKGGRLIVVPRLGPLRIRCEYDLSKIQNIRLEKAQGHPGDAVQIRFDYGGGRVNLGDAIPRPNAERLIAAIQAASVAPPPPAPARKEPPGFDIMEWVRRRVRREVEKKKASLLQDAAGPAPEDAPTLSRSHTLTLPRSTPSWTSPSSLVLIGANLIPIAGVLLFGWNLGDIMVLFWAESAVIGFYTMIKLAVVGKWLALLVIPFFGGHFGGFMAAHFLFVYYLFVRGIAEKGPEGPFLPALAGLFGPLWFALLSLFVSHGVSFVTNFLGRKEHVGMTVEKLMSDPYRRIIVMHLTIIFGGWLILLLKTPTPALVLLVLLKTAADLRAHRQEHGGAGISE